jgi:carboxyl-terminal processing protease
MKKTRIAFIFLLLLTSGLMFCAVLHPRAKSEKRIATMQLLIGCIEQVHYKPVAVNDSLSDRIYTLYLKRLNRDKLFFTQEDMDKFKVYEFKIDSEINHGTFEFYDLVNQTFDKRLGEDSVFVKKLLAKPFDFTVKETLEYDADKVPFPKNETELHDRWRRLIKYDVVAKLADMLDAQEKSIKKDDSLYDTSPMEGNTAFSFDESKKAAALKAVMDMSAKTGKKDTTLKVMTYAEMEKEARKKVMKTYEDYFHDLKNLNDTDKMTEYFEVMANAFDPHTDYFAPEERKSFEINMSGQLEGIGAQLKDKNGEITVDNVIPGSPAWKSGEIKEGDVFLKVGQGNAEPVNIVGMPLDKAVQLIRGKKGTEVKLTVKTSGGLTKVVSIIRDVIHIESTYAHAAIINNNGQKMGYIRLPEFYTDMGNGGGRRCSDDVKALLKDLEAENVKGVIIDLRDNGGGSLPDVVRMAGLFVPRGPIVQVENRDNEIQSLSSRDTGAFYKGPLVVLVNGASASASEIFTAAIQDYKRGIIMGSQTYGKATVQQILSLDQPAYASLKPLGSVKVTIQKYYRITGGTTQNDGVVPDVPMPDPYQFVYEKEKDAEYHVNTDKITPAEYKVWGHPADAAYLASQSAKRTENDSVFNLIREEAKYYKQERDSSVFSLNLAEFRKEEKQRKEVIKHFEALSKPLPFEKVAILKSTTMPVRDTTGIDKDILFVTSENLGLARGSDDYSPANHGVLITATADDNNKMAADTNEAKTEKRFLKALTRDAELYEATRVISDMK